MAALGLGLIIRGYSTVLFKGFDIGSTYIPHGFMVGAGIMALIQSMQIILKDKSKNTKNSGIPVNYTRTDGETKKNLALGVGLYLVGALILAIVSGIILR